MSTTGPAYVGRMPLTCCGRGGPLLPAYGPGRNVRSFSTIECDWWRRAR